MGAKRCGLLSVIVIAIACSPRAEPTAPPREAPDAGAVPDVPLVAPSIADASLAPATVADASAPDASPKAPPIADKCASRVLGQSGGVATCTTDDDCSLFVSGCCPPCGRAPSHMVRATNRELGGPTCNLGCPACASSVAPELKAICRAKRCVVEETICAKLGSAVPCPTVRKPTILPRVLDASVARCASDADCRLVADQCCACSERSAAAVSSARKDAKVNCSGARMCPECFDPGIDPTLSAICKGGLCRVADMGADPRCLELVRSARD